MVHRLELIKCLLVLVVGATTILLVWLLPYPWVGWLGLVVSGLLAGLVFGRRWWQSWLELGRGSAHGSVLALLAIVATIVYAAISRDARGATYISLLVVTVTVWRARDLVETWALHISGMVVADLSKILPKKAQVTRGSTNQEVFSSELERGDLVTLETSMVVPADIVVVRGRVIVDESHLHGPGSLVVKNPGDEVYGGVVVTEGKAEGQVIATSQGSLLGSVQREVSRGEKGYWSMRERIERWSIIATWLIMVLGLVIGLLEARKNGWDAGIETGLFIFLSACPFALASSLTIPLRAAINRGVSSGIVIRRPSFLGAIKRLDTICFGKTGVINSGHPRVVDIISVSKGMTSELVLSTAAALESLSDHPFSEAILVKWNRPVREASYFKVVPGAGVRGIVHGQRMVLGSQRLMRDYNVHIGQATYERIRQLETEGKTLVFLARENTQLWGIIAIADEVRSDATPAVRDLRHRGYRTVLISADSEVVAIAAGQQVGADETIAEVTPEDKERLLEGRRRDGCVVMLVDHPDDASEPALRRADIAVTTDLTPKIGHITLVGGGIGKLPLALRLGRLVRRVIWANIAWWLVYSGGAIWLAVWGGWPLWTAPLLMLGGSSLMILNSLRPLIMKR